MNWLKLQPHPFRLLLVLERILLCLSAFKLFGFPGWGRPAIWNDGKWFGAIAIKPPEMLAFAALLTAFGILGLRLPTTRWAKGLYLAIEFILLGTIAQLQGWGLDALSPLLIVVLLRSSVMVQRRKRWLIAGLVWLIYPITLAPFLFLWGILHFVSVKDWTANAVPEMIIQPDGGIQLNLSFNPEQVQQISTFLQNSILYLLSDAVFSFGLILIFVLLLVSSLVNERQGRRTLALAHEQLYQYSLQIEEQATLQERTRIAREVHDSLGHLLAAQSIVLENTALSLKSNSQEAQAFLEQSKRLGAEARRELRQAILMLRSNALQGQPFEAAIDHLVAEFESISGIQPTVTIHLPMQIPERYQVALYRILEEALTNIQKHSKATQVDIELESRPDAKTATPILCLKITDNGKGFNLQQNRTGFGLQGMQERAKSLGGEIQFRIQSGYCIIVLLPLLGAKQ